MCETQTCHLYPLAHACKHVLQLRYIYTPSNISAKMYGNMRRKTVAGFKKSCMSCTCYWWFRCMHSADMFSRVNRLLFSTRNQIWQTARKQVMMFYQRQLSYNNAIRHTYKILFSIIFSAYQITAVWYVLLRSKPVFNIATEWCILASVW